MTEPVVYLEGLPYRLEETLGRDGTEALTARPATPEPRRLLVTLGDSFTDPAWTGPDGWPLLVAERTGLELVNLGAGGSGYVRVGGSTFPLEAAATPADAMVVLVWGGYNDRLIGLGGSPEQELAARATFLSARRLAPGAELVVVGPQWPASTPDPTAVASRDVVRRAALDLELPFVDSLGWFAGRPDLILADGLHPNPAAQPHIADRMTPLVTDALTRIDARGATLTSTP